MMSGGRELNEEYYRFNLMPLGKDAVRHLFFVYELVNSGWFVRKNKYI